MKTQFTLRDVSESLVVTRPAGGATLETDLIPPEFSRLGQTMVVFLGTERMEEVLARVECPPETPPAAVVYHASWPDQKVVRGTVADIAAKARAAGIERTALIVIGKAVEGGGIGLREVGPLLMTGTVVIALERFLPPEARRIADALGAEVLPFGPDAFRAAFSGYDRIVALMSAGIAVRGGSRPSSPISGATRRWWWSGRISATPSRSSADTTAETTLPGNLPLSGSSQ